MCRHQGQAAVSELGAGADTFFCLKCPQALKGHFSPRSGPLPIQWDSKSSAKSSSRSWGLYASPLKPLWTSASPAVNWDSRSPGFPGHGARIQRANLHKVLRTVPSPEEVLKAGCQGQCDFYHVAGTVPPSLKIISVGQLKASTIITPMLQRSKPSSERVRGLPRVPHTGVRGSGMQVSKTKRPQLYHNNSIIQPIFFEHLL